LKNEPSPITAPRIAKVFSPACDCETRVAAIQFRLRKPDRVRVQIVDDGGDVVRTLVPGTRLRRGTVRYTWNGRDDEGRFVPQGVYKPRVHLADQHRTIDLPNDMRVDTTPPRIALVSLAPRTFSPNGDGRNDRIRIAYKTSEPAHAMLFVDGERVIYTRRQLQRSSLDWNGKIEGKRVLPGSYRVWLAAEDHAGNVSNGKVVRVVVRYVQLARDAIQAKARTRFGVRVSADRRVHWRLGARRGTAPPGMLVLRAPAEPGRYRLVVSVPGYSDGATVIVSPR
jgi:hypothetical protein